MVGYLLDEAREVETILPDGGWDVNAWMSNSHCHAILASS